MPNRKAIARWTLWFLLLLPLAQVGGPLAWACGVQSHCAVKAAGCGGAGQTCGSACGHAAAPERSCCRRAILSASEADCACRPQPPADHSALLLLLAPELPGHTGPAAPQLRLPGASGVALPPLADAPVRLVALSPYGSRGPPLAGLM